MLETSILEYIQAKPSSFLQRASDKARFQAGVDDTIGIGPELRLRYVTSASSRDFVIT